MSSASEEVYIGVDIGSSSAKAVAVRAADGVPVASGRGSFPVHRPTAGGWEIDAPDLFDAVCHAIRELPADVRAAARALATTGQMCGLVTLDRRRRPAGRCLPIFDDRSIEESRELEAAFGEHLRSHAGNGGLPIYTLPKLLWLRHHRPQEFSEVDLVLLPKDYVRGRLTGEWMTEASDASGTLAFDQRSGAWDEALLASLDLDRGWWPQIVASSSLAGALSEAAALETGLRAGTPVAAGASDMAAVPIGVGASATTELVISLGTAAHVISPVDSFATDVWPVQQYTSAAGPRWFRFGAVYSGAACAGWLLDLLDAPGRYELFAAADERPPGEHVLFMPYLAGAGAPHEIPDAAGAFVGLRLGHNRTDLALAVLEGLVFEVARVHAAHDPAGERRIHVTGGGTRLGPVVQILADALGRDLLLSDSPEAAAIGAACLAARALGDDRLVERASARVVVSPHAAGTARLAEVRRRYEEAAGAIRSLAPSSSPSMAGAHA